MTMKSSKDERADKWGRLYAILLLGCRNGSTESDRQGFMAATHVARDLLADELGEDEMTRMNNELIDDIQKMSTE